MFFSQSELQLQLLGVFKITRGKSALDSFNQRSYDTIALRLSGSSRFFSEGKTFTVQPEQLLYIPSSSHYHSVTEGESLLCIHFNNLNSSGKQALEVLPLENPSQIEALLTRMYRAWTQQKQGYFLQCSSMLYELVYLVNLQQQNRYVHSIDPHSKIKESVNYIHANYRREQISVAKLAELSSVSTTYFRKIFARVYAVSPCQYINNLKLEYAAQLLQSGLYTVTEAGERAGFPDPKYFSKLFKRHYGQTPRAFCKLPYENAVK